jgi:hypothetical protein
VTFEIAGNTETTESLQDAERPVTFDIFRAWLAEHGIESDLVRCVEFVPQSIKDSAMFLRVERYALNEEGKMFIPGTPGHRDSPATEVLWVPLKTLPGVGA